MTPALSTPLPWLAFAHDGYVTADLDAAADRLAEASAVVWGAVDDVVRVFRRHGRRAEWSLRYVHSVDPTPGWELLQGGPGSVWATAGELHLHHRAFWTQDLADDLAALVERGWSTEVVADVDDPGLSSFAYLTHPGELRIELCRVPAPWPGHIERGRTSCGSP